MNYGMKTDNPIDHVRFYEKKNPDKPVILRKEEVRTSIQKKILNR